MKNRKIKLDVVLKSGTVVRLHVTEWKLSHNGLGIADFSWTAVRSRHREPIHFNLNDISAIVRHR